MQREVGDGNRRAEHFGTAVDRKQRGHQSIVLREKDRQDPGRDRRIGRIFRTVEKLAVIIVGLHPCDVKSLK
jgi:hypothetical protein